MPSLDQIENDCTAGMNKAVEFLKDEVRGIRTGRAHPSLIEHLKIEVSSYGSTMELRELATIAVPEPTTLMVKPFDPGTLKDIEKGLQTSSLGVTPMNDGKTIRLPIPPLSGERRNELAGQIKKMAEAQKIVVRNVRRDMNKLVDVEEKAKTISEDQAHDAKDAIQKLTKNHEDKLDEVLKAKTAEIKQV